MTVRLLVRQRSEAGGHEKPTEVLLSGDQITLGRDPGCQVVLTLSAVSRNHARITRDGALYFIEDLGSSYGTQVNGQWVPKGEKRLLRLGDVIAIAQFDVTFDKLPDTSRPPDAKADDSAQLARQALKGALKGLGGSADVQPYFRIMNGPREGEHIMMSDAKELVAGRDESADLVLKDDLVSRRHARLRRDWSGTHVEDLQSRNGIRVNRRKVTQRTLMNQDEVEIGNIRLLYIDPNDVQGGKQRAVAPLGEDPEDTRMPEPEPEPNPVPSDAPEAPEAAPPQPPLEPEASEASEAAQSQMSEMSELGSLDGSGFGDSMAEPSGTPLQNLLKNRKRLALLIGLGVLGLSLLVLLVLILIGV
jgi:pSer/pThr/pTyr-binding forkhead associated (FHA) protein